MPNIEYDVLIAPTAEELIAEVNLAIEDGWEPIGGVSVVAEYDHDYCDYAQAVMRTANDHREP